MINTPLFDGKTIRLTYIDLKNDPKIEAAWSADLDYVRAVREGQTPRLLWPKGIKEVRERQIKEANENRTKIYFAIRSLPEDQLLGFLQIPYMNNNHNGRLDIVFGSEELEERFGDEALELGLRYAFDELNFHRVNLVLAEYGKAATLRARRFGFALEVVRREAIFARGQYWDQYRFGLLEHEWRASNEEQGK